MDYSKAILDYYNRFGILPDDVDDLLTELASLMKKAKPFDIFKIMNMLILENEGLSNEDKIPVKILNRLYFLYKENAVYQTSRKPDIEDLKQKIKNVLQRYSSYINKSVFINHDSSLISDKRNASILQLLYLCFYCDYDTISFPQFIHAINMSNDAVIKIFGIDSKTIIKGIAICFFLEDYVQTPLSDRYLHEGFFTSFPINDFINILDFCHIERKFIDVFFSDLDEHFNINKVYLTKEISKNDFCLGLKADNRIYFNRSRYLFNELWDFIYHHEEMNIKKGDLVEDFCFGCLSEFFNIKGNGFVLVNVFKNLYTQNKEEQDIIVIYNGFLLLFECKSHNLREPFRDFTKGFARITRDFKDAIQNAYLQGKRIVNYINDCNNNPIVLFDSDKPDRKIILDISFIKPENVILFSITLDNYMHLATNVDVFIQREKDDVRFPMPINLFTLHIILDSCINEGYQNTNYREFARSLFINYCLSRTKYRSNVQSPNGDELDIFGAFISNSRAYLFKNEFDQDDELLTTVFGNSFSHNTLKHINTYEKHILFEYVEKENDILNKTYYPYYSPY